MHLSVLDQERLREALQLAQGSIGLTDPNPRVGCIIGTRDGRVLGSGATQAAGSAHAEVMALRDAAAAGCDVRGATAWVTLEPCAHFGRTPPCCDALVHAGLARCVVAMQDPNPAVAGSGIARLRAAGVVVDLLEDDELMGEARDLNVGFFSRMERGRPWVRMKLAASLDGRSALVNGQSQWITGQAARVDGHQWRKRASAVLTGIGTVLADNPRLDVRYVAAPRQPLRIVLDGRLRTPLDAAILGSPGSALIVGGSSQAAAAQRLRQAGAEVWDDGPGEQAAPLIDLLRRFTALGINELHVEAGPQLSGAFMTAGLVDEWLIYLAPKFLGPGRAMADMPVLTSLTAVDQLDLVSAQRVGTDLRLRMRKLQRTN